MFLQLGVLVSPLLVVAPVAVCICACNNSAPEKEEASSTTGSNPTGPMCGDQACPGDTLRAFVLAPVAVAELPGVRVTVCVDDASCGSGSFPDFDPSEASGNYFPDSSFSTTVVEVDGDSEPYSLVVYRTPTHVGIFHPLVIGDRLSVSFESDSGETLGQVEGALETTTTQTSCAVCVVSTFSNVPEE